MLWTEDKLREALRDVRLPGQKQNIIEAGLLSRFEAKEKSLLLEVRLPERNSTFEKSLQYQLEKAVQKYDSETTLAVEFVATTQEAPSGPKRPRIGTIIAVGSGKGGVGKSAVTVNLAAALKKMNYKVGILDCDLYGPSIPTMLGVEGQKPFMLDNKIQPIDAHGMRVMSAGFFVQEGQGLIWRGPMVHKLIQQFYWDVDWDGTDVLLIDLPPGTGDAPLSLSQTMPINGAILVSLPQRLSLIDVHKAYAMFEQVKIPVLGMIENMSEFICPNCQTHSEIFHRGGVKDFAKKLQTPFLGEIPIDPRLREASDRGVPFYMEQPDSAVGQAFSKLAERLQAVIRTADESADSQLSVVL